jgi:hypothetical protein
MKTLIFTLAMGCLSTILWAQEAPDQHIQPVLPKLVLQPVAVEVSNLDVQPVVMVSQEVIVCPIGFVEPDPHLDVPLMDLLPHVPDSWQTINGRVFYPTRR